MSKTLINIRGLKNQEDPNYRYKMEKVELVKQGSFFSITNICEISNALNRDPQQLVSFLKKFFGSAFTYKNGVVKCTKADLTYSLLQDALYQFIENNVLCKICCLPETILTAEKKKTFIVCQACGHKLQM